MKTLNAFYFSGTGNTRYITEYLLGKFSAQFYTEKYDVTKLSDARDLFGADLILLSFPIYGSSPPIPMREFVQKYRSCFQGKDVLIAETQYFFSGDGAASLGRTLEKYGARIIGAEMFNMPNNLADCKAFPIKNGAEIKRTLARARKKADSFAQKILSGNARRRGFSLLPHAVGYYCQRKYWRKNEAEKRKKLRIDPTSCVGCGLCAKHCPVGNIRMEEKDPKPLGKCVLCYRCVNLCPRRAITIIGSKPPVKQYKGPR